MRCWSRPSAAEMLWRHGVRRVQISVYSSRCAIHDAITKVPGFACAAARAIPLLQQRNSGKTRVPVDETESYGVSRCAGAGGKPRRSLVLDMTITPMIDGNNAPLDHRVSVTHCCPFCRFGVAILWNEGCPRGRVLATAFFGSAVSSGIESAAYEDLPCSAGHNRVVIFRRTAKCTLAYNCPCLPGIYVSKSSGNLGWRRGSGTDS